MTHEHGLIPTATGKPFYPVRLMGATDPGVGRLEVFSSGIWASVPYPLWSSLSGALPGWMVNTACHELGFQRGEAFRGNVFYPVGTGPQWGAASCDGFKNSVSLCSWSSSQYGVAPDTNIVCFLRSNSSGT